jgi:hypothetical protein
VNRSWSGFLPQNEIVLLQWAALEDRRAESVLRALISIEDRPAGDLMANEDDKARMLGLLETLLSSKPK